MLKKLVALTALGLALCSVGCGNWQTLKIGPGQSRYNGGRIVDNNGGSACSLTIATDNYGIVQTGPLDYDMCRAGYIGARVFLEISDDYNIRIIRIAP